MSNAALISEARAWWDSPHGSLLEALADALEAAELETERWHDAALIGLANENALADQLAAAQAVIADAVTALSNDGERDYLERIYATQNVLAQSPTDSLQAAKANVWDECLDVIEAHELNTEQAREGNPYRAALGVPVGTEKEGKN